MQQETLFSTKMYHAPRDVRKEQIVRVIEKQGRGVKLTARQISRFMGMAKSPNFVSMLEELCSDGVISCDWSRTVNNLDVRVFFASGAKK